MPRRTDIARWTRGGPAGPAGVAQAGLDGPRLAGQRRAADRAGREGPRLLRGRQGRSCEPSSWSSCSRRSAPTVELASGDRSNCPPRRSITRFFRSCATPTRTWSRIPTPCPRSTRSGGRSMRASRSRARFVFTPTCSERRPSACGHPKARSRISWCRSWPPKGWAGWPPTRTSWRGRSASSLPRDGDGLPLRPEVLYRPYQVQAGGARVHLLFRDHALSDRIGFHYQSWEPHHAADDFLWRVRESGRRFAENTGGEDATITVILDGENAWEHYAGGGPALPARALRPAGGRDRHPDRDHGRGGCERPRSRWRTCFPDRGSTPTSTSGRAIATTSAPGRS